MSGHYLRLVPRASSTKSTRMTDQETWVPLAGLLNPSVCHFHTIYRPLLRKFTVLRINYVLFTLRILSLYNSYYIARTHALVILNTQRKQNQFKGIIHFSERNFTKGGANHIQANCKTSQLELPVNSNL